MRYHDPCRGAYTDDGEENGKEAQYSFPQKGGIVGVHCGARGAGHGRGTLEWATLTGCEDTVGLSGTAGGNE